MTQIYQNIQRLSDELRDALMKSNEGHLPALRYDEASRDVLMKAAMPILERELGPITDHVKIEIMEGFGDAMSLTFQPLTSHGYDIVKQMFPDFPPPQQVIEITFTISEGP